MNQPGDFDEALRKWAGRPSATSATDAARAVVARLQAAGGKRQAAGGGRKPEDGRREAVERLSPVGSGFSRIVLRSAARGFGLMGRLTPAWATVVAAGLVLVAGTAAFIRSLPPVATGLNPGVGTGLGVPSAAAALGAPLKTGVATGLKTGGPTMVPARDADVVLWLDEGTPVYVFLPGDGPAMR